MAGATVLSDTVRPYINQFAFQEAKTFQPTIVVIMLGSNDAHLLNYLSIDEFVTDYEQLIDNIRAFASNPRVLLAKPPPIFTNDLDLSNANLVEGVIPRIEQVATKLDLPTIDVNTPLVAHPEYFVDGVHVNQEGARIIASEIYRAIVNLQR